MGIPTSTWLLIDVLIIHVSCSVLEKAGVVKRPEGGFDIDFFVNKGIAHLT